jgi:hypothetical protein
MKRVRSSHAMTGVFAGLAGAAVARSDPLFHWFQRADWSQLPATIIGTAIPAAGGFFFASAIAEKSVRRLKDTELEAQHAFDSKQHGQAVARGVARVAEWDDLRDRCRDLRLPEYHNDSTFGGQLRARLTEEWDAATKAGAAALPGSRNFYDLDRFAFFNAEWGQRMRDHLEPVIASARRLVVEHGVYQLHIVVEVLEQLQCLASDITMWIPLDEQLVIAAYEADREHQPSGTAVWAASYKSNEAIRDLELLADAFRGKPHDAEEVDTTVMRGRGSQSYEVDVAQTFRNLEDLIEAL